MSRAFSFSILLSLLTTTASARGRDVDLASWQNLGRLRAGQRIEVNRNNQGTLKGDFVSFTDESVSVRVKQQDIVVPRAEVRQVQVGSSHWKPILIGAGIGAGGGAAIGAAVAARLANESGGDFAGLKPAITAAMAGVGALIGLAVGSLIGGHHRTVYQAR